MGACGAVRAVPGGAASEHGGFVEGSGAGRAGNEACIETMIDEEEVCTGNSRRVQSILLSLALTFVKAVF